MNINHEDMGLILKDAYEFKKAVDIKGVPGIGKSEIVFDMSTQLAEEEKRKHLQWNKLTDKQKEALLITENIEKVFVFFDIRLSSWDVTDAKFPKIENDYAKFVPALIFKVISNPKAKGVLFFDELNHAPPSVVKLCYQVFNNRAIGEIPISEGILLVSAGNLLTDKSSVFEEDKPLVNRRFNYLLNPPNVETWTPWAIRNNIDLRVVSYLQWKQSNLFQHDFAQSKSFSFATPRSWKNASDMIKKYKGNTENDLKMIRYHIGSAVGEGIAEEFIAYIKLNHKFNVKEILANPQLLKKYDSPEHVDLRYAIVSSVAEFYREDQSILNQTLALCNYMQPEFAMFTLRLVKLIHNTLHEEKKLKSFSETLIDCPNWANFADNLKKYLLN
jgi:hypothetical protein